MNFRYLFFTALFLCSMTQAKEPKIIIQTDSEETRKELDKLLETVRSKDKPMNALIYGEYEALDMRSNGEIMYAYMNADEEGGTIVFHDDVRGQYLPNSELLKCAFRMSDFNTSKYSFSVKLTKCTGPEYLSGLTMNVTSKSIGPHPSAPPLLISFIHQSRGQTSVLRNFEMKPIRKPLHKLIGNFHKKLSKKIK